MGKPLLFVFTLLASVSLACSLFTNKAPSGSIGTETSPVPTAVTNTGGFTAETTGTGGAQFKWKPVSGADTFLLEVKIADEFMTLARLPATQTSYEQLLVPAGAHFTYRLSSLTGTKQGDSLQVSLDTPPATINPLQVKPQFDMAPAGLTIDPNNFDPSTIDPNNFDPSKYMAQPIQTQAVIGPAGGEITVTGSNGIVYMLSVPQDALRFDVPITLKVISAIPDLPLSGGLTAAVFIEPDTVVFDIPASLKMTLPQGFPAPTGPLPIAFAFGRDGTEFHLYPFDGSLKQSYLGQHLASLSFAPIPPSPDVAKVRNGGGFGKGSGTSKDVHAMQKHGSGNAEIRTEQDAAIDQIDDLAPVQSDAVMQFAEHAQAILDRTGKANDWKSFREELDNFITLINAGGAKGEYNNSINAKVLDMLVKKAQALLEKNKNECVTFDDFQAQDLVERLRNPKDSFSKLMSDAFKTNYGQKLLDDLTNGVKNCTFDLSMQSKEMFKSASATLTANASAPKMKLFLTYFRGEVYLSGGGDMSLKNDFKGDCSVEIKQYDKLYLYVAKLSPSFVDGRLQDFGMGRLSVIGWDKYASIAEKGTVCPTMIAVKGGGDLWTGLFSIARISLGNFTLTGWKMTSAPIDGGSLTATWFSNEPSFAAMGQDGQMSENTKFVLTVTNTTRKLTK